MNKKKVDEMKKAYDHFLKLANKVSLDPIHAADLLEMNSAYNRFVRKLTPACLSCGDAVEEFFSRKKNLMIDPTPYCKECFLEKKEGKIPNVTGPDKNTPRGGAGGGAPEPSPWQENAIRDMESS